MGFRSALRVPIRLDGRFAAGLAFMAHAPGVYQPGDVLAARRIAQRFALCLSGERGRRSRRSARTKRPRAPRSSSRACGR